MSNIEELKARRAALLADRSRWNDQRDGIKDEYEKEDGKLRDELAANSQALDEVGFLIAQAEPVDRTKQCTVRGNDPTAVREQQLSEGNTGQHSDYIVLCEEERAKGFVRPVRRSYVHRGKKLRGDLVMLQEPYRSAHDGLPLVAKDRFMIDEHETGTLLTQAEADSINKTGFYGGCGTRTTMGLALAETYARDPKFYGSTFCVNCNMHFPVCEFVWDDGERVGA